MLPLNKLCLIIVFALSFPCFADYLEVRRSANLKDQPIRDAVAYRKAIPGENLELLYDGKQTDGYYRVWLPLEQQEAFIYRTYVRKYKGSLPNENGEIELNVDGCGDHLVLGIPAQSDQILCRKGYALGYNYTYKVPDWVSYHTVAGSRKRGVQRKDNFIVDKELPADARSTYSDYTGSGYDRGHMVPSAIIRFSQTANDETFLYSNMAPQLPGFNRNMMGRTGAWGALEDEVRNWLSKSRDELYVVSGTSFNDEYLVIGPNEVGIPDYFFKIIYDPIRVEAIAFWMPQDEDSADQIERYVVSIDEIEEKTGFDFFSALETSIQDAIESNRAAFGSWLEH